MPRVDLLFGTDDRLAWWQKCDRALLVFGYGVVAIRPSRLSLVHQRKPAQSLRRKRQDGMGRPTPSCLAGRRTFGRWAALDIIMSIVVGSSLSRALTGDAELLGDIAATTLMVAVHWGLAALAARWEPASHLLEGRPTVLALHGVIRRDVALKHAITHADLHEAPRQGGVDDVEKAGSIALEPSGRITVVKA